MRKCYLVSENYGNHYECPIKVFISKDEAEEFVKVNSLPIKLSISIEAFQMALDIAWNDFPEDMMTPFPELIMKTGKFPEWSLEELKKTNEYLRRSEIDWIGYKIEELELCQ